MTSKSYLRAFCLGRGLAVDDWISEIGGGMNFTRKRFLALMSQIGAGLVSTLVIAHKDRLVRFTFEYFEHMAAENGCQIIVANQQHLSPQQEMVKDLMTIVHTFSCLLYGLRNYKEKIREAAEAE